MGLRGVSKQESSLGPRGKQDRTVNRKVGVLLCLRKTLMRPEAKSL